MGEGHEFYCHKDEDGRCQECVEKIMKPFAGIVRVFKEMEEKVQRVVGEMGSICDVCAKQNADYAISRTFREILPALPTPLRMALGKALLEYAGSKLKGIAMPLSEKAWKDSMAETGT